MANVEKININSTDYDIADAKALRNKSTANTNSFIDERAGTSSYPTIQSYPESNIIGYGAYAETSENLTAVTVYGYGAKIAGSWSVAVGSGAVAAQNSVACGYGASASVRFSSAFGSNATVTSEYSVAVGESAKGQGLYSSAIGCNARASASSVSVGAYSVANGQNGVAIGRSASINSSTISYAITVGYSSYVQANYGIAIGPSAGVNVSSTDSIAIGNSARVNMSCQRSVAIGKQATAAQSESVQLGQGTNTKYGSLQFRSWQVIDQNGKIPVERLPEGVQFAVDNMPTVPSDFYYSGDDSKQLAVLYKGETVKDENDDNVLVRDLCYRTQTSYSRPSFRCTWVGGDYVPNENKDLIYIDQEKLFLKLAEISRANIDDDNFAGSYVGGDNSTQDMYFYYDGANQTWSIEFGSDSIETGTSSTPDMIDGITDLREYGIYITGEINLPEEDNEEIFDVEYYAPIYCDGFDYGDNTFTIDYMKFMDAMCNDHYGFPYATGTDNTWSYSDGTNDWDIQVLPKTYEFNDEEYEDVTVRFEYDGSDWRQYINGENIGYGWSDAEMASVFGIHVGDSQRIEYIEMVFRPARQISWEQFDPIDTSKYGTKTQINNLQSQINTVADNAFRRISSSRDMNDMTTEGAYHISAAGCTNIPTAASTSMNFYLFVLNRSGLYIRQMIMCDVVDSSCSHVFVRCKSGGTWTSWEPLLSPSSSSLIADYDTTKKQKLIHNISENTIKWVEDSGGGSVAIDNSTITKNGSDQLQAVATINSNTAVGATNPVYDWVGTLAEYTSQAVATTHPEWLCYITDDLTAQSYEAYTKSQSNNLFVAKGHEVIAFQAPTADNNYTWYRKYADGWVEQGGKGLTNLTIVLPVPMADDNYFITTGNNYYSASAGTPVVVWYDKTSTGFSLQGRWNGSGTSGIGVCWEVKGMAA